jgi:hypothetical protein
MWGETIHFVRRPLFGLLCQPRVEDDEYGAVSGMKIGKGSKSTRIKSAQVHLCPQIPTDLGSNPGSLQLTPITRHSLG